MLWTGLQSFSFIPLMASVEMIFEYFFANLAFRLPWQPIKFRGLDKKLYVWWRTSVKLLSNICTLSLSLSLSLSVSLSLYCTNSLRSCLHTGGSVSGDSGLWSPFSFLTIFSLSGKLSGLFRQQFLSGNPSPLVETGYVCQIEIAEIPPKS